MKYATGESVEVGDRVSLPEDPDGIVAFIPETGDYGPDYPEAEWGGYLKSGAMIFFPAYGLIHYEKLDHEECDVKFVSRRNLVSD